MLHPRQPFRSTRNTERVNDRWRLEYPTSALCKPREIREIRDGKRGKGVKKEGDAALTQPSSCIREMPLNERE